MTPNKKILWFYAVAGAILSGYVGYLINGAYIKGAGLQEIQEKLNQIISKPFENYYNETTFTAVMIALGIYVIAFLMHITNEKHYMAGKEHGTARFADLVKVRKKLTETTSMKIQGMKKHIKTLPKELNEAKTNLTKIGIYTKFLIHICQAIAIKAKKSNYNRILSQQVWMSLNTRKTRLNNNVLVIGGSGAGKTLFFVKPNLMQMNTSFVITDPKSEILNTCGEFLRKNGYVVKVLNLISMEQSDGYNPFAYIRQESDVVKLINNLIANTTPKNSNASDPFWEKAEGLYLQALFYYVWLEMPKEQQNFRNLLMLLSEAEVNEKGLSELDKRMKRLECSSELGDKHPAIKQYNKCVRGAGDTVRSIIISANSRLAFLENEQILNILSKDDMNLEQIGIGKNGDAKTKTALFCVIPDSDKTYNSIVGLLYTQLFQELYYQADFNFKGRLPIHVTFMLDEFANIALPDDFCSLLSTMRSREISSVIIIQNLAQIKALFKDTWETVPGNCDSLVYLGGNEQSTHKYISELLGKATIHKKSSSQSRGRNGSTSHSEDVLGRELMTPEEVRKLDNKKCLVFIRGIDPILDQKFNTFGHPMFKQSADGKGNIYVHFKVHQSIETVEILNSNSFDYYKRLQEKGENVYINTLTFEQIMHLSDTPIKRRMFDETLLEQNRQSIEEGKFELEYGCNEEETLIEEDVQIKNSANQDVHHEQQKVNETEEYAPIPKVKTEEKILHTANAKKQGEIMFNLITSGKYSLGQIEEVKIAMKAGLSEEQILQVAHLQVSADEMRKRYRQLQVQNCKNVNA